MCYLILSLGRKLMGKTYFQNEYEMMCCLYSSIQHFTHPWHGNKDFPSHICPREFNHTCLMFQKILPVFSMWIIQGWEGVNDIFLSSLLFYFLADQSKKFVNKYFLIQRKIRSNDYYSVSSESSGKIFWYWLPDIFWKWIFLMPDQMFPEIKFGSLNLM